MCGRFQLDISLEDLERYYSLIDALRNKNNKLKEYEESYFSKEKVLSQNNEKISQENILKTPGVVYPDNSSLVVTAEGLRCLKWGLPFNKKLIINAREETIFEKKMFSKSVLSRRCLIPANLFFEWKDKNKYEIELRKEKLFSMAGIYDIFHKDYGSLQERYVIITTEANEEMGKIHHRMPVILPLSLEKEYLNPSTSPGEIKDMLKPYKNGSLLITSTANHEQLKLF